MTYDLKISVLVKTFATQYDEEEMMEIISNALWSSPCFRDVYIYDLKGIEYESKNT